jgi:hypothetical protein
MKKVLAILCSALFATSLILGYTVYSYKEKNRTRFQVNIPIDVALFREKLSKAPPDWMTHQIHSDLSAYEKTGISKQLLDRFFQGKQIETLNLIRFQITNRQLSFSLSTKNLEHRQFRHILAALEKLNELVVLPDVDFIVSLEDGFPEEMGIPLFVYAKSNTVSSLVLMPDFKALTGYPDLRIDIEKANQKWAWENKTAKAFWRGATTGGWLTALNWDQIARVKLALLARSHPDKMDARLTGVVQCDREIPALIKAQGLTGGKVSQVNHLKYKYLVDVDGNSCSFERYFWVLLSNCVVLKQITPNIQWYYSGLKPYEHFVPVKEDLSDLMAQIEWVQMHDKEAKQIAENATAFAQNELALEDVFVYMTHLLQEYGKHMRQN